jgi:hypothetical protein
MAALNLSVKHGQTWEDAKANFIKGVVAAEQKHGAHLKRVEWSDDRTAVRIAGTGFDVTLTVDPEAVHAVGHVPFFVKLMGGQITRFIEEALRSP